MHNKEAGREEKRRRRSRRNSQSPHLMVPSPLSALSSPLLFSSQLPSSSAAAAMTTAYIGLPIIIFAGCAGARSGVDRIRAYAATAQTDMRGPIPPKALALLTHYERWQPRLICLQLATLTLSLVAIGLNVYNTHTYPSSDSHATCGAFACTFTSASYGDTYSYSYELTDVTLAIGICTFCALLSSILCNTAVLVGMLRTRAEWTQMKARLERRGGQARPPVLLQQLVSTRSAVLLHASFVFAVAFLFLAILAFLDLWVVGRSSSRVKGSMFGASWFLMLPVTFLLLPILRWWQVAVVEHGGVANYLIESEFVSFLPLPPRPAIHVAAGAPMEAWQQQAQPQPQPLSPPGGMEVQVSAPAYIGAPIYSPPLPYAAGAAELQFEQQQQQQ